MGTWTGGIPNQPVDEEKKAPLIGALSSVGRRIARKAIEMGVLHVERLDPAENAVLKIGAATLDIFGDWPIATEMSKEERDDTAA